MKLLICTSIFLFASCATPKLISEKAYIAVEVDAYPHYTYYNFVNLSYTEGKQHVQRDTAQCFEGDTVKIKIYKSGFFGRKRTVFITYKNQ